MKGLSIGQEQAREWFEDHSGFVYRIALMLTQSPALADDITQETFLSAFRHYHRFDDSRPVRPWLYRITVNTARSMQRKFRWHSLFGHIPEKSGSDFTLYSILEDERDRDLWEAIQGLSPKLRQTVTLHYLVGLPLSETAEILGITLGTCKSRINAALVKLRNNGQLAEDYGRPLKEEGL
ncbi:ECF RNA polymerase sigma factor SigR [compost metagenome]